MQYLKNMKMLNLGKLIFLLTMAVVFSSCEKVVDIDLNEANKKYVIEGIVSDEPGMSRVALSQTKNFDENNSFVGVSGAVITVTDRSTGNSTVFIESLQSGIYQPPTFTGVSGRTYDLSVVIGNETYTATSTMPQRVEIDSLYVTDEFLFTDTRKIANVVYQDPPGRGNSYRFVQRVNGNRVDQIFIQNDEYTDSRRVESKLFFFADDDDKNIIKSGDQVEVDLFCIDPAVYKYWFSLLRSSTGDSGQATPANPVTNIKGGALGYFSAQTSQTRGIIVP